MKTPADTTLFIPAMATSEGAGVTVHRTIGTPAAAPTPRRAAPQETC